MRGELTRQIEALVRPIIDELSAEIVELSIRHRGKTAVVEIIADRPGGITIGECTFITKKVDWALEKRDLLGEDYIVEVASPGLDRALKTQKDFTRVIGKRVRVHLLEAVEGKVEHHGEVLKADEDIFTLKIKDKTICVPYEKVSKAVQEIE